MLRLTHFRESNFPELIPCLSCLGCPVGPSNSAHMLRARINALRFQSASSHGPEAASAMPAVVAEDPPLGPDSDSEGPPCKVPRVQEAPTSRPQPSPGSPQQPRFSLRRMLRPHTSLPREPLPGGYEAASWWAQIMRNVVAPKWDTLHSHGAPRQLLLQSSCTGMGSEFWAGRVLGIPFSCISAAEVKPQAREIIRQNFASHEVHHIFQNLKDQGQGHGCCCRHSQMCTVTSGARADLLIAGTPCQPYSSLQSDKKLAFARHDLYDVTFGSGSSLRDPDDSFLSVIRKTRPRGILLEQVEGFATKDPLTGEVPLRRFLQQVLAIKHEGTGAPLYTAAKVFLMNSSLWLTMSRPRLLSIVAAQLGHSAGTSGCRTPPCSSRSTHPKLVAPPRHRRRDSVQCQRSSTGSSSTGRGDSK